MEGVPMGKRRGNKNRKSKSQLRSNEMSDTSNKPSTGMEAIVAVLSGMVNNASMGDDLGLIQGVQNILSMMRGAVEGATLSAIPGTGDRVQGLMAFRRSMKNLTLAFVGGQAPVFYLPLDKLILLVEQMHDKNRRTVVIRNCSESSDSEFAHGQVLAKFNTQYSALQVTWGDNGVVIESENEINKRANYYINPDDLLLYYMAAKIQMKGGTQLEELLQANEGWRKYDIPTNPLDPGSK
jgi:hypothetical protein